LFASRSLDTVNIIIYYSKEVIMSNPGFNEIPRPQFRPEQNTGATELLEAFRTTQTKIAIQKDGALTDIARSILLDTYGICVPPTPKGRVPVSLSEDRETGFVYARNKGICDLVASRAVNMAIVGTDRLIEDEAEGNVDVIASYRDKYSWSIVLATPSTSDIQSPEEITKIATQYPIITRRYFESLGMSDMEIISTSGGTELYPYLGYGEAAVEAVVDLTSTGETLAAHDMVPWTPSLGEVYPVLIQTPQS
jgi:ATP phosphoribosyltransferase